MGDFPGRESPLAAPVPGPDFRSDPTFGHTLMTMNVESRDSVSLKPAELDEFWQLLTSNGLSLTDAQLDLQVEAFPLAVVAMQDSEVQGLMLGSLERIGGTPAILWPRPVLQVRREPTPRMVSASSPEECLRSSTWQVSLDVPVSLPPLNFP